MNGGSHDGADDDQSLLVHKVDGLALGEFVLLHGGADLGDEVGYLFLRESLMPGSSDGLADGGHK